ncbi:hypothetical protein [Methylobacterium sp. R2-1]|uniref:hypothetical protein n=1 Tax=Methylobacterium sp. R2-1 TaxID=2587064 RepID=UPI00160975AE|nr:hypothetical protein [Methylobacterium sp. R2-1]MBB2965001.1 hypothetical protein [Methylobacterium sp. R2-1]
MTDSIIELDTSSRNRRADFEAASYFVLEPVRIDWGGTEILTLDVVGDDDLDEQEPSLYSISLGLADRPALRHAWEFKDFSQAVAALQEIHDRRPDARLFVSDCHDEQGLEILGDDMLLGLIAAQAERDQRRVTRDREWRWLAEDAAGNGPPEGRNYSPFFAAIAQALPER